MIFYSEDKDLKVFNPAKKAITIEFKDGIYETDDKDEIALLEKVYCKKRNQDLTEETITLEVSEEVVKAPTRTRINKK